MVLEGSRQRAPYEKIKHILDGLVERHGWEAVYKDDALVGAKVRQTQAALGYTGYKEGLYSIGQHR